MLRVSILWFCFLSLTAQANEVPRIAVASSLQFVMPQLVKEFQRQSGFAPSVSYGSSGNFRRQLTQGAPFEMFMSADESYVEALSSAALTKDNGVVYAVGQLALILPAGSRHKLTGNLTFISEAIETGSLVTFAIANPDHAPYGRAAREILVSLEMWEVIEPYLVRGENASQALQFALSGSSQGGLVPYALTFSPAVEAAGKFIKIDSSHHQPIRQRMVLLKNASNRARQFFEFIASKPAQKIFESYGYQIPSRPKNGDN